MPLDKPYLETDVLRLKLWNSLPVHLRLNDVNSEQVERLSKTSVFGCTAKIEAYCDYCNCVAF